MSSYFDILPKEIVTHVISPKLDSASRFIFWRTYYHATDWIISKRRKGFHVLKSKWVNGIYTREDKILPVVKYYDICKYSIEFMNYFLESNIMLEKDILSNAAAAGNIQIVIIKFHDKLKKAITDGKLQVL